MNNAVKGKVNLQKALISAKVSWTFFYDMLIGKPQINGVELTGNKTLEELGIKQTYTADDINFQDGQTFQEKYDSGLLNGDDGITPNIQIGTVTTLEPNEQATVERTGTDENPVFNFGIPRGQDGENATVDEEMLLKLAIKSSTEGNPAIANDSAEWKNQGIEVYGQTTQVQTTGAQLVNQNELEIGGLSGNEGQPFDAQNRIRTGLFPVVAGKTYTMSGNVYSVANSHLFDNNGNKIGKFKSGTPVMENAVSARISFKKSDDSAFTQYNLEARKKSLMINEGSTVKPWEPYTGGQPSPSPDFPQEMISKEVRQIKLIDSQLFDINSIKEVEIKDLGIRYGYEIILPVGSYILSTESNDSGINTYLYMRIKSKDGSWESNKYIVANIPPIKKTILEVKNGDIIYFYNAERNSNVEKSKALFSKYNFMLNAGTIALPYEEYKEQVVQLSAPITLRGVPVDSGGNVTIDGQQYISDVIIEKNGVYGVERVCYEIVEDGSKTPILKYGQKGFYLRDLLKDVRNRTNGLCDKYIVSLNSKEINNCMWLGVSNKWVYLPYNKYYDENLPDNGLANLKASLAENPIKIITYTDTPTFEPLPQQDQEAIRKLMTYYPTTVLDAGAWSKLNYVADPKNYIDGLAQDIKQIKADILKLGGQ